MPKLISLRRQKLMQRAEHVNPPILRELITLAANDPRPLERIEREAGYSEGTFRAIVRHDRSMSLRKAVVLGEALGYELKWVKK